MVKVKPAIFTLLVAALVLIGGIAHATIMVDQINTSFTNEFNPSIPNSGIDGVQTNNLHWQQEITSSLNGTLSGIDLYVGLLPISAGGTHPVAIPAPTSVNQQIRIAFGNGGVDYSNWAYSNTVNLVSGWNHINLLPSALNVAADQKFIVDLTNSLGEQVGYGYTWDNLSGTNPNPSYYGGDLYIASTSGWINQTAGNPNLNIDLNASKQLAFKTYVDGVAAVPVPGAVWLLGSGLAGLAGLRRRILG